VVESDAVSDTEHLLNIVKFYRQKGFRIALDDLGAGYGSLNLLTSLKPDFVKFDRELICGVDLDPYKQKVFVKLVEMAHELGIHTLAEGVETEGEYRWLAAQGVEYLQGYFFARPASPPPTSAPVLNTVGIPDMPVSPPWDSGTPR
jgi:EAL domain-containing protein (putative c-di-GMP-specific phosphodiesterase class I)